MRRADRTAGEDHLARRIGDLDPSVTRIDDPGRALAVERDAVHQRLCHHLEVGALRGWLQVGLRGAGAAPPAAGLLAPADAVAGARRQVVDVLAVFDAELPGGIDDRLAHRRPLAHRRSREVPAFAMNISGFSLPVLSLLEVRQYVVPAPAAIAELAPMVEILGLATDVDEAVDRA